MKACHVAKSLRTNGRQPVCIADACIMPWMLYLLTFGNDRYNRSTMIDPSILD